ncbi:MAG: hypothetical protein QGF20_15410, partial [Alphaproteobacteria bacterium]|nr:hypothetical protein [Alphaproteobacteria bacterium]
EYVLIGIDGGTVLCGFSLLLRLLFLRLGKTDAPFVLGYQALLDFRLSRVPFEIVTEQVIIVTRRVIVIVVWPVVSNSVMIWLSTLRPNA